MSLSAGTKLGPYEILSPLGAGGMGEVYRANDSRLSREVAVKVLPSHVSPTPEARQRFEREARTVSQLSHPHVCALYDVGREGDTEYLVMELLEGETLGHRLARGALPIDQAMRFGAEIASALQAAHRKGIVHRDLKPGNVMITKTGVKLLDFGLARAFETPIKAGELTRAPTVTVAKDLTAEGSIVGTVPYMAPEQLRGEETDARTDVFALGAVLYEMSTGRRAFPGNDQATLISAILTFEPPPISEVRPVSPPGLDLVVRTCIAKDPADRWQSAHDVELQLRGIPSSGSDLAPEHRASGQAVAGGHLVAGGRGARRGSGARDRRLADAGSVRTLAVGSGPLHGSAAGRRCVQLLCRGDFHGHLARRDADRLRGVGREGRGEPRLAAAPLCFRGQAHCRHRRGELHPLVARRPIDRVSSRGTS